MTLSLTSPASTVAGRWTAGVKRHVLPNGLTLLVQRDDSAPVVAVVTRVRAGFFDEPDHWAGISHVFEHMFFKGTPRRGVGVIARETKAAGGYLNASTSYDHTSYFAVLPASGLQAALDIQSDALRHSVVDAGELARELQVIIQEARRKLDTPGAVAYETLHEVMFDRHRIRRWRIGHEDALARLTRDDLWAYYRSRYVPERTVVSIVGAVDPARALELARRAYGDWPEAPGAVDPSPEEPWRRQVRARTLRGDVSQTELALGWRAVPPLDPDAPALDLAAAVLASGRGSWLYRSLREPGMVTSISAHSYAPTEIGVFSVTADLDSSRLNQAVEGVAREVARLRDIGPSEDDVDRARTLVRASWARRMESMEGRASALAAAEQLSDVGFLDREYEALGSVTPAEVREAAARYLRADAVSAVAYLPRGEGEALTVPGLAGAFATAAPARDAPQPGPAIARRAPRPASGKWEAETLYVELAGADLLLRRKTGVPLVSLGIYVPRVHFDPPGLAGLGALTVRAAVRGAGELDAAALAFAFERAGGTLGTAAGSDWLGLGTSVLAERLPDAAVLLDLVYTRPRLAERETEAERGLMIAEAEQIEDDMFRFPFQLAFGAAFGEQGYGLPVGGLPHTLAAITAADAQAWSERALLGVRPVVLAVGDMHPEEAARTLAGVFGGYPARPRSGALRPGAAAGAGVGERVVTREKAQTALAMVFPGPARSDPDRIAAQVWAAAASGLGGRMFEALRDRRSLAYTVVASAWPKGRAGALMTYIATSPEREEEARAAMLDELGRFAAEAVSEAELTQAVNYLAGQSEVSRQSASALSGEILEAWLTGGGLADLADPAGAYRGVNTADVQRVAGRYLDPARRSEGVVQGIGLHRVTTGGSG